MIEFPPPLRPVMFGNTGPSDMFFLSWFFRRRPSGGNSPSYHWWVDFSGNEKVVSSEGGNFTLEASLFPISGIGVNSDRRVTGGGRGGEIPIRGERGGGLREGIESDGQ